MEEVYFSDQTNYIQLRDDIHLNECFLDVEVTGIKFWIFLLEFGGVPEVSLILGLDSVLGGEYNLLSDAPQSAWDQGDEADLENVVLFGAECKLADHPVLRFDPGAASGVCHHHVHLH